MSGKAKKPASPWVNRIVGYGEEAPDQLLANPLNWRLHPKPQQDALSGVLHDVGIVQNVIVNKTTGHMVDGHLRVSLALREGQPTVPITYVELSEAEEAEVLATLDPLSAMAATDAAKLDELLRDVNSGSAAVTEMLAELAEKAGQYGSGPMDSTPDETEHKSLAERFILPPFSVLDARQGYWQDRKRAWLSLGIQSELGRGEGILMSAEQVTSDSLNFDRNSASRAAGGAKRINGTGRLS